MCIFTRFREEQPFLSAVRKYVLVALALFLSHLSMCAPCVIGNLFSKTSALLQVFVLGSAVLLGQLRLRQHSPGCYLSFFSAIDLSKALGQLAKVVSCLSSVKLSFHFILPVLTHLGESHCV